MGYMGKYLRVNLSKGSISVQTLDMKLAEMYIGGKGLGARLLYDSLNPGTDPLSPDNVILFMTGPLTGTAVQTSGRWCIVTKSPHTGIFNDSHIGGKFGHRLKRAGFDYILVTGKASSPIYIDISDEGVDICQATDLWGLGTFETERILQKRHPSSEVTSIGPAGENLVTYACAVTDRTHVAGRGGVGAVMGSKNLKAVVVHGRSLIEAYNKKKFSELTKELRMEVLENPNVKRRHELGTAMWVRMSNDGGFLPTHNFQSGVFKGADAISGERMSREFVIAHTACFGCGIACGKKTRFEEGKHAPLEVDGPEYETIALLGSNCGISDLSAIAKSSQMCDDLGLDTISTGGTIAFAMEATEKGLLNQNDVADLRFGNEIAVHELIHLIAKREGLGELLAEGSIEAAEKLREECSNYAIQVKKLELPGVEPRASWGMALAYITSDRGGCHQRCWTPSAELGGTLTRFTMRGIPEFVKKTQDERSVCFSLVLCDFLPFDITEMIEILNSATGFSYTERSYLSTGERIWNLIHLFNLREGVSRSDDTLPRRFTDEEILEGGRRDLKIPIETIELAKTEYYALRGWDQDSIPSRSLLRSLGLHSDFTISSS